MRNRMLRPLAGAFLLLAFLVPAAYAAPLTIQVTIGATATQLSTVSTIQCRSVEIQNNAAHDIRVGDSTVTSSRGILVTATGGSYYVPIVTPSVNINMTQWYISGTQNDVIEVLCDTVPN